VVKLGAGVGFELVELLVGTISCVSEEQAEMGLSLRCWNRTTWALPWSHFEEAHFETNASSGTDSIRLIFGNREVMLRGQNLAGLMEPIACHLLSEVREVSKKLLALAEVDAKISVVWEIGVCEIENRAEQKHQKHKKILAQSVFS